MAPDAEPAPGGYPPLPPLPPGGARRPYLAVGGVLLAVLVAVGVPLGIWLVRGRPAPNPAPAPTSTGSTTQPPEPTSPTGPPTTGAGPSATATGPTSAPATGSPDGLVNLDPSVADQADAAVVTAVVSTFDSYFSGINNGRPTAAHQLFSSREKTKNPYPRWSRDVAHSRNEAVTVSAVGDGTDVLGAGPLDVDVSFTSHQPGSQGVNPGETCTHWSLTYTLVPDPSGTGYLIDNAVPAPGGGHTAC